MSKLQPKIAAARQIVARSAGDAVATLNKCAKSDWLKSVAEARPNLDAAELANLSVSLFLAQQQFAHNGVALREMRSSDREYRGNLRQSLKLLKEAEKTAGLFANAIAAIRAGMQSEVNKPPLFDEDTFRSRSNSSADAKGTALALLQAFCPSRQIKNAELAKRIKAEAQLLLATLGFEETK